MCVCVCVCVWVCVLLAPKPYKYYYFFSKYSSHTVPETRKHLVDNRLYCLTVPAVTVDTVMGHPAVTNKQLPARCHILVII